MKIGISVPNNWGVSSPETLIDLAVLAEELGLASIWTSEHFVHVTYVRDRIGERPYYHSLAILSAIASRTTKIALGTSVLVLPFHHPFDLAKYIATLDCLSRGRVILGVGSGNVEEEFDVLGMPWAKRGAMTDEILAILRTLWEQESAAHEGEFWQFSDVHTSPKPYRERRIPIWIGGASPPALRRVARMGDGWQPVGVTPEQFAGQVAELRRMTEQAGRDPAEIEVCARFNVALDDTESAGHEMLSLVDGRDMARMVDIATRFQAAGADHFIYALNGRDPEVLQSMVRAIAQDVLPLVSS
ncbi:probable F420-dependent oxidoreductase, Rv2161c family [Sphingobium faniae]|nr:probable F420-dependent oxidoreductase, Rv2161c family [Sphingobium faniae]